MFHPKLPEICLHVTHNLRISEYELQRAFKISKGDIIYIYFALNYLGVINIEDGDIIKAQVIPNNYDLKYYEEKVLELVNSLTKHFESGLQQERLADEATAQAERELKENDPLIEEIIQYAINNQRISINGLQRQFRIAYNRAAYLVERLEEDGIISPMDSNGARTVLLKDSE